MNLKSLFHGNINFKQKRKFENFHIIHALSNKIGKSRVKNRNHIKNIDNVKMKKKKKNNNERKEQTNNKTITCHRKYQSSSIVSIHRNVQNSNLKFLHI